MLINSKNIGKYLRFKNAKVLESTGFIDEPDSKVYGHNIRVHILRVNAKTNPWI